MFSRSKSPPCQQISPSYPNRCSLPNHSAVTESPSSFSYAYSGKPIQRTRDMAASSGRKAGLNSNSIWDVRLPEEAQSHVPKQILVSIEERKNSNGLKLPKRIRLNSIRQSFLTVTSGRKPKRIIKACDRIHLN